MQCGKSSLAKAVFSFFFEATPTSTSSSALFVMLVLVLLTNPLMRAQNYKESVLYSFTGNADGGLPLAALLMDAQGNLYGTTYYGGDLTCNDGNGCGTMFEVNGQRHEVVLHNFGEGTDGQYPMAGVVGDLNGNFYGTTYEGGTLNEGTVFELDKGGTESVLYSFKGQTDGVFPESGLVRDSAGIFYGTTVTGGTYTEGTAFQIDEAGNESVLYEFSGDAYAAVNPVGGLVLDAQGNLYGTTIHGGASGFGAVFKLTQAGNFTVLHSFSGPPDGGSPIAGLVRDKAGNLYGTTYYGGKGKCNDNYGLGCGVVFKVDTHGKETVLHSFAGGKDGEYPAAPLIQDSEGNLYGTTFEGGAFTAGTVFRVTKNGKKSVLHSFSGPDGEYPRASLIRDAHGNFYGTTEQGGTVNYGTVFKLTP